MNWIHVEDLHVRMLSYDKERRCLSVNTKTLHRYNYYNVKEETYHEILNAKDKWKEIIFKLGKIQRNPYGAD